MTAISFRVSPLSGIHHGSGTGSVLVDREIVRTPERLPFLAGSALKGKFRHAASLILQARNGAEPHAGVRAGFCVGEPRCELCRIFGCPMEEGIAFFSDALPVEELLAVPAGEPEVRATTALDRHRRTAKAQHLFTTEISPAHVEFAFSISGNFSESDARLLEECAFLLTHFGAGGSRGVGAVRIEVARG